MSHLPGVFQVADLGTKPLSRPRIMQLLELVNIRPTDPPECARTSARVLSRISSGLLELGSWSAEAVAGLALLASIPRVTGQPLEIAEVGRGWLQWFFGVVVLVGCLVFGWWIIGINAGPWRRSGGTEPRL